MKGRAMKYGFWVVLVAVCVACEAGAEGVRLSIVGGGRVGGSMSGWNSDLSVKESGSGGIRLGVALDEERWVELLYSIQDSEVRGYSLGQEVAVVDLDVAYYHVNVVQEFDAEAVTPYVVGGLGLTHFSSSDATVSSDLRFSINAGLGLDIPLTENMGFLLEGRAYVTFVSEGTYVAVGTGGGSLGFTGSAFLQAEGNAGVYFQF